MSNTEPKTYWEQRCVINEIALEKVMGILASHLPSTGPHVHQLWSEWCDTLDALDAEFKETPNDNPPDPEEL